MRSLNLFGDCPPLSHPPSFACLLFEPTVLVGNDIGDDGFAAISKSIGVNARLKKLNLDGFALPIRQLKGIEPIDELNLSDKRLGFASALVIAKCFEVNAVLTKIDLRGNTITSEGWVEIFRVLRDNAAAAAAARAAAETTSHAFSTALVAASTSAFAFRCAFSHAAASAAVDSAAAAAAAEAAVTAGTKRAFSEAAKAAAAASASCPAFAAAAAGVAAAAVASRPKIAATAAAATADAAFYTALHKKTTGKIVSWNLDTLGIDDDALSICFER